MVATGCSRISFRASSQSAAQRSGFHPFQRSGGNVDWRLPATGNLAPGHDNDAFAKLLSGEVSSLLESPSILLRSRLRSKVLAALDSTAGDRLPTEEMPIAQEDLGTPEEQEEMLKQFLELDQPLQVQSQEKGLLGVRKAQVKLAAYYLSADEEERGRAAGRHRGGEDE